MRGAEEMRDRGRGRCQDLDEKGAGIEASSIGGAIATVAHLARYDGRPERVFGAPIGASSVGSKRKLQHGFHADDEGLRRIVEQHRRQVRSRCAGQL